jgi:putative salt-induced outer membrane protein YdiY
MIQQQLKFFYMAIQFLIIVPAAPAQIVNVADQANRQVKDGFSFHSEISWNRSAGNTDLSILSGAATFYYQVQRHFILYTAKREFGKQQQNIFIDTAFQHLRYRYQLLEYLDLETFLQFDRDTFRRLKSRTVFGIGPRVTYLIDQSHRLFLGVAPMIEKEIYESTNLEHSKTSEERQDENLRLSISLAYLVELNDQLQFSNTAYYQPLIRDAEDRRVLNITSLNLRLNQFLSLKFSGTLSFDSDPPRNVAKTDQKYENALVLNF